MAHEVQMEMEFSIYTFETNLIWIQDHRSGSVIYMVPYLHQIRLEAFDVKLTISAYEVPSFYTS